MADLIQQLNQYKKKYYTNQILKGVLISGALLLTVYLSLNAFEHFGRFGTAIRGVFLFTFTSLALFSIFYWIAVPIARLTKIGKQISNEEASLQIGRYFPNIDDKLINTLQLSRMNASGNASGNAGNETNTLLAASIQQKTNDLSVFTFTDAVDLGENRKYLKYLLPPLLLLLLIFVFYREFITESSARILNYNEHFAEKAPFNFLVQNKKLEAFKNEDFTVSLKLDGRSVPEDVYLLIGNGRFKMPKAKNGGFEYTFNKIQKTQDFTFEAAGFSSNTMEINVLERPTLLNFTANLSYPAYLGKPAESLKNIGNLVVPQGTQINWQLNTGSAESLSFAFDNEKDAQNAEKQEDKSFVFARRMMASQGYQIKLKNQFSENKDAISYNISVIPDEFPKISMEAYQDTALFNFVSVGGTVSDDYGLSSLRLFYRITDEKNPNTSYSNVPIGLTGGQTAQNYYFRLELDQFQLKSGQKFEYFTQVWDNDGANGAKSARSGGFTFKIPDNEEAKKDLKESIAQTESQMEKTIRNAQQLQAELNELEAKLKTKKNVDFNDKKQIQEILKKKKQLEEDIKKLQELNKLSNEKQDRFSPPNEELQEKFKQLQKLMDNVLDEKTKKLYEELEKLLEKNRNDQNVLEMLDKLENKEENTQKELERAMEMFKQMKYDQKLDQTIKELEKLAEDQEKLAEKTEKNDKDFDKNSKENQDKIKKEKEEKAKKDKENKENPDNKDNKENKDNQDNKDNSDKKESQESLEKQQKELSEKFEDIKKEMEDLKKQNEELNNENPNPDTKEDEKEVEKEQKESEQNMKEKKNKKASENQKKAAKKMKEMKEKMEGAQEQEEEEQNEENQETLRQILDNLVTLSFSQEQLMKDFKNINLTDPRFVALAQKQLKLKDDAQVIDDSLTALAKREPKIESFVTREMTEMKSNMSQATENLKERKLGVASSKQQFAMTSMNNLALMLSDALKDMQGSPKEGEGEGKGKKKGKNKSKGKGKGKGKGSGGKMSDLQKELSKQLGEIKKGGATGQQLSEQLAKMAAKQESLRKMLEEMSKKGEFGKNGGGDKIKEAIKQMEKNEDDLVNKRLTDELVKRQKEIETRLLEAENSKRERDQEEKRKGETSKVLEKSVPKNLQQYNKSKNKQTELLKSTPASLSPYYRKEVDKYFEKIK